MNEVKRRDLESLMRLFDRNSNKQMLLKRVVEDEDGDVVECFTKHGAKVYGDMIDFIYCLRDVVSLSDDCFDEMVDELDDIASQRY